MDEKDGSGTAEPSRKRPRAVEPPKNDDGPSEAVDAKPAGSSRSKLPEELANFDFSKPIRWGKHYPPDCETPLPYIATGTPPQFTPESPALCHHVNAIDGHARACTIHLKCQPGQRKATPVQTPMFMPVGTKGCLKGLSLQELTSDPALACPIILGNTYHLAIQPGTELVDEMGGLHAFQGLDKAPESNEYSYNLLTDSGGFQMVSLVKLSKVTEEGVSFSNPFKRGAFHKDMGTGSAPTDDNKTNDEDMLLLRPEDSIRHQNNISANIIMALDDVVSSVEDDEERFVTATHRTLRWYDRCYKAHAKESTQNLFPIVQGGLDVSEGGLRDQCLAGFMHRQVNSGYHIPGYAIGGLAGGETKDAFWKVVHQSCRALPDNKPRYLMGVGYPLDLVVCTALGVDMYDCVYPTRTARFGVALVPGPAPGTLKLRGHECAQDQDVIQDNCPCQPCREGISRTRLQALLKAGNPLGVELITQHNIAYMMALVRNMRAAILENSYTEYCRDFCRMQYPGKEAGGEEVPGWVIDALQAAGISL